MEVESLVLNHIALVVEDLREALAFWGEKVGLPVAGAAETIADEGVDIAFLQLGDARLELIQPRDQASGVARYLAKRGAGLHHLCLEVPSLDAKLGELAAQGIELINEAPRERDGRRYAFVHPASTGGVLLELYERR
ncbi:MAG: VOC family protein [Chloroflexi bacterium]|nr:VOC family protein [Chloroflexota bacterium]MCY4248615.1 VOC family protein [Chloroflexota bacterium]